MYQVTLILLVIFSFNLNAQDLHNTSWKTNLNGTEYIVEFTSDSLILHIGNESLDLSTFDFVMDTLFLTDHPNTVCVDSPSAIYLTSFIGDTLILTAIEDDCDDRRNFLDMLTLTPCILSYTESTLLPDNLILFPNPSHDGKYYFNLKNQVLFYKAYSLNGELLCAGKSNNMIDLSALSTRQVVLHLFNEKDSRTFQLFNSN